MHTLVTLSSMSRYDREPPRRSFPSGSSPSSFSLSAKGAFEKSPKRLRSQGSLLHHLPFNTLREHKAAETVLAHGQEEKKEKKKEERAQAMTLLGSYLLAEPWKTMAEAGDY
jgi:hypothetical protein